MYKYSNEFVKVDRPDWTEYFMGLCFFVARRSEDANTRHGCILTDQNNHIIGTGYNSLPKGTPDGLLPNTRPNKYWAMIHAEENAALNTVVDTFQIPGGAICYCTARCCLKCLYRLHNKNVKTFYLADTGYHFQDYEKEQEDFDNFVEANDIKVFMVKPNLNWIREPLDYLKNCGLVD